MAECKVNTVGGKTIQYAVVIKRNSNIVYTNYVIIPGVVDGAKCLSYTVSKWNPFEW